MPHDDDAYRLIFEPGADPIQDRFQALRALHEAGVGTFAVIQPVLPTLVQTDTGWVERFKLPLGRAAS